MKSLLDKDFKYVPAVETNIRRTFARVRREQAEAAAREAKRVVEVNANVKAIVRTKVKA